MKEDWLVYLTKKTQVTTISTRRLPCFLSSRAWQFGSGLHPLSSFIVACRGNPGQRLGQTVGPFCPTEPHLSVPFIQHPRSPRNGECKPTWLAKRREHWVGSSGSFRMARISCSIGVIPAMKTPSVGCGGSMLDPAKLLPFQSYSCTAPLNIPPVNSPTPSSRSSKTCLLRHLQ